MANIILLIEDNQNEILLAERAFKNAHISDKLVVVHDGVAALDYLFRRNSFEDYDTGSSPALVLLDLNLPRISGLEILKQIRANPDTSLLPVVVLTSSAEERDLREAYSLGANSYIRKPTDFSRFVEVVQRLSFYWLELNERPSNYRKGNLQSPT